MLTVKLRSTSRGSPIEATRLGILACLLVVLGLWIAIEHLLLHRSADRLRREIRGMRMEREAMLSDVYVWPVDVCMVAKNE